MAINLGSGTISALYLGSTEIQKAYLGSIEIYSVGGGLSDYAVLTYEPEIVADFVNNYYRKGGSDTTFADLFSFSRASLATYMDSAGILQTASNDVPRVTYKYDASTNSFIQKGLIVESTARTNYWDYGVNFGSGNSTYSLRTISATEAAPDGSVGEVTEITHQGGGTRERTSNVFRPRTNLSRDSVWSLFVKSNQRYVLFQAAIWGNAGAWALLDLVDEVVVDTYITDTSPANSNLYVSIEKYANDWFRIALGGRDIIGSSGSSGIYFGVAFSDGSSLPADYAPAGYINANVIPEVPYDENAKIWVWGLQYEHGVFESSYIRPVDGAATTRAAEDLRISAADLAHTTPRSHQIQAEININTENQSSLVYRGTTSPYGALRLRSGMRPGADLVLNDETDAFLTSGVAYTEGYYQSINLAYLHGNNRVALSKDGTTAIDLNAGFSLPISLNNYDVQILRDSVSGPNGIVQLYRSWEADITNAGLEAASS